MVTHALSDQKRIYTDWANHYLAKSGHTRLIRDLQKDVSDGVLLAEVIQVVANEKVKDINGYPKSRLQMIENIDTCLSFLAAKGVNIKGLCAEEIRDGNLKAILGLFFSLSRYKQQHAQKEAQQRSSPVRQSPPSALQPPHGVVCPIHGLQNSATPPAKTQADMLSSHPSKATAHKAFKLSVAQKKSSRLPGPSVRVSCGEPTPRGSSSRRSQSFNHFDKSKPSLSPAGRNRDRCSTTSPIMSDSRSVPQPSSRSSKPWRSKSLSGKHSATYTVLSVKPTCNPTTLEVPPKVIAQKSMMEKLKLFNSKGSSKVTGGPQNEGDETIVETELVNLEEELVEDGAKKTPSSSPKHALKGIAQRTLGRALMPKKSSPRASEKDKEKSKITVKDKDKGHEGPPIHASAREKLHLREEMSLDLGAPSLEAKKSNSVPKGTKGTVHAKKDVSSTGHSGIPKPSIKAMGSGKIPATPPAVRDGDKGHSSKPTLSVHKSQVDITNPSLASSSFTIHSNERAGLLLASHGNTQKCPASNTVSVQLPHPQQHYSHPNTATVAPFRFRSHIDLDKTEVLEESVEGHQEIHNFSKLSLDEITGEDPEVRRLRTVRNIADLRQNLEETMTSLRGTQISTHSTLETTFDSSITTEVSGRDNVVARSTSMLPWRQGSASPRLQAGDAPSSGRDGFTQRAGGGSNRFVPSRCHLHRQTTTANSMLHLTDMALEGETTGYMSDGDLLSKAINKTDNGTNTSGYTTDGGLSVLKQSPDTGMAVVRQTLHGSRASQADTDSWDDSSSVSSGISDTLDTDELNTSSSLSSFINTPSTPRQDTDQQTDTEKHLFVGWSIDERRCSDTGSDGAVKMDTTSGKWRRHPSDVSDESDKSSASRKNMPATISHTGSWRRGMTAQVGITSPRAKASMATGCGMLRASGTGKTDDAKVSEKGRLSPCSNGMHDSKKPPLTSTCSTFGFRKQVTASGAVITSGSATLGKIPKSMALQGGRSGILCRQSSVDDAFLPSSAGSSGVSRSSLQYRSLPRPSRSTARSSSTSGTETALRTAMLPKGRSSSSNMKAPNGSSIINQTDREKGVSSDPDSGKSNDNAAQTGQGRQEGGKYSELSSPTLRRLFGGKANKQASFTSTDTMKYSTVISNPHATSGSSANSASSWSSTLSKPAQKSGNGEMTEEALVACINRTGGTIKHSLAESPLSSPTASPNTLPQRQDRYAHPPQLRSQEDARDWLRSHSAAGLQEFVSSSPFSPSTTLTSPSSTRFTFTQLASSPPAAALRTNNDMANQDTSYDPYSDSRVRNSSVSLEEKSRTMSSSGSFRDGLEEVHGSSLSLVSSTSSVYSTPEEKSQSEIRKLRRELDASQEKVSALTTQLSANAHLVAAFEKSLGNMTIRLQSLTMSAEQKDSELSELRKTIELLKKQSTAAQEATDYLTSSTEPSCKDAGKVSSPSQEDLRICRQHSSDSVSSITSATSHSSVGSNLELDAKNKKKKKNWLRSSFKQAFTKKKSPKSASSHSDIEEMTDSSLPSSPKLSYSGSAATATLLRASHSNSLPLLSPLPVSVRGWGSNTALMRTGSLACILEGPDSETEKVMQLRSELRDKEMKLTDIRLEALSSAHQLDQLRESMNRMQGEVEQLKSENSRLKMETQGSCSRSSSLSPSPALSSAQCLNSSESTSLDMLLEDSVDGGSRKEDRRVKIVVNLEDETKWKEEGRPRQFLIGSIGVSGKTKWDVLDGVVRRLFKEYIIHVDPVSQLGLNSDSVLGYSIGEIHRTNGAEMPELLPCGYLVGHSDTITVKLKGVEENSPDSLVFETLIPKPLLQRYVSQLQDHRRIILSGPSGTGKSFLAIRLAEHVVLHEGRQLTDGVIATFNVNQKSSKELHQYLSNLADQCSSSQAMNLPVVLILDNLQHSSSLGEIFSGLLNCKHQRCPYIIGTMNHTTVSTSSLQLHHNFRWVLCGNHQEPLKGLLGRFLRRKLMETEISSRVRSAELVRIIDWIPSVWHHLNHFLETHGSSDVTIGPRLFLSCPMDVDGARVWFTDLWNYSIIPYVLEAVREGLQYGRRAAWEDPAKWVIESFPWAACPQRHDWPSLLQLRPEDVGFHGYALARDNCVSKQPEQGETYGDPLMDMLMRLKEAAHCAGSQSSNSNSQDDDVAETSLESTL
ncbi:neuron navigator 2-like isoform X2 [Denticeps clupeoides]|uniref:neuron navigator 2-like isoform X2 n=1 Tax=Denticeps clupeoides TaxID=299321 RepID=UPI0010A38759|nr:neuron navigator 2-like isoform X2 [Denticeps clupeoides]